MMLHKDATTNNYIDNYSILHKTLAYADKASKTGISFAQEQKNVLNTSLDNWLYSSCKDVCYTLNIPESGSYALFVRKSSINNLPPNTKLLLANNTMELTSHTDDRAEDYINLGEYSFENSLHDIPMQVIYGDLQNLLANSDWKILRNENFTNKQTSMQFYLHRLAVSDNLQYPINSLVKPDLVLIKFCFSKTLA